MIREFECELKREFTPASQWKVTVSLYQFNDYTAVISDGNKMQRWSDLENDALDCRCREIFNLQTGLIREVLAQHGLPVNDVTGEYVRGGWLFYVDIDENYLPPEPDEEEPE